MTVIPTWLLGLVILSVICLVVTLCQPDESTRDKEKREYDGLD